MKTDWDYSILAQHYIHRPSYAPQAIDTIFNLAGFNSSISICDIGAGVGHLTIPLLERGHSVVAVEPNDQMRSLGIERTSHYKNILWFEGVGEQTQQPDGVFDLVTFGSSFNVCNREEALKECIRILKNDGWFFCTWNHRDLENQTQKDVEDIIKHNLGNYDYGTRREDQSDLITKSGLFKDVKHYEFSIVHEVPRDVWINAWRSHATLYRQAQENVDFIIKEITDYIYDKGLETLTVPYLTRCWLAQVK